MDVIAYLFMGVIMGIAAVSVLNIYRKNKDENKAMPWEDVRLIVIQALIDVKEVEDLRGQTYEAMEDHVVRTVMSQINNADFISDKEKALVSEDFVRSLVAPRMKQLKDRYPS